MQLKSDDHTPFYTLEFVGKRKRRNSFVLVNVLSLTKQPTTYIAHTNYLGYDPFLGMVVASIMKQPEAIPQDPNNYNYLCYIRSENVSVDISVTTMIAQLNLLSDPGKRTWLYSISHGEEVLPDNFPISFESDHRS